MSPFVDPDDPSAAGEIQTHWSGPLSTGDAVLMIINPLTTLKDIQLQWRHMEEFANSSADTMFEFTEIGGQGGWKGTSTIGFVFSDVEAHGSLVMIVREAEIPQGQIVQQWANGTYS